jgi:hypothetical protein
VTPLGSGLLDLAAASRREFVMCAPFAKLRVVTEIVSEVPDGVELVLYTRWRPDEVAAGVSDTQVLSVVESRGGVVRLHDRLHAKFYRNESSALIGSANLTATALGWVPNPNLEILVKSGDDAISRMESRLASESVLATAGIAQEVEEIAKLLPMRTDLDDRTSSQEAVQVWVPSLRMPSDLYHAYSQGVSSLTARSAGAAAVDLAWLDIPAGLDIAQFEALVGHRLRNQGLLVTLDNFLDQPRRFGEVRQLIGQIANLDRAEAEETWQTTMRWMLEFLPRRYSLNVFRHSEVISLVASAGDGAT